MTPKIKFYSRSFNKELYYLSRSLYQMAGYPCVRLTDQSADDYFFMMLQDTECDIAINVDEDCFICNIDIVLELARKVWDEGIINIGCSDGSKGVPRSGDPLITNPFFNVFNLSMIRDLWDSSIISKLKKGNLNTVEPYYNFFYWTLESFPNKTKYLPSELHKDGLSTILFDETGHRVCCHSWFARHYKPSLLTHIFEYNDVKDINHTERIQNLIREIYTERGMNLPTLSFPQKIDFFIDGTIRWFIKVPQRLYRLPRKLANRWK